MTSPPATDSGAAVPQVPQDLPDSAAGLGAVADQTMREALLEAKRCDARAKAAWVDALFALRRWFKWKCDAGRLRRHAAVIARLLTPPRA